MRESFFFLFKLLSLFCAPIWNRCKTGLLQSRLGKKAKTSKAPLRKGAIVKLTTCKFETMSFLDALDDSLESAPVPTTGAFQPKVKPRGKKPNVAAKSKVTSFAQKNVQSVKVALPESAQQDSLKVALPENTQQESVKIAIPGNAEQQSLEVALPENTKQLSVKVALSENAEQRSVKVALPAEQQIVKVALLENAEQQSVNVSLPENAEQQSLEVAPPQNVEHQSIKVALPENAEQQSIMVALPETNSPLKENDSSPAQEFDERHDVPASLIYTEVNPVEGKPFTDALEPTYNLNGQINDQRKGWRQKLKEKNAVGNSEMIPASLELAAGNAQDDQHNDESKQQMTNITISASVEIATGNDQDDQHNDKSKEQRQNTRGKKPARGSKKLIQESPTETPVLSNVDSRENCLDTNVGADFNVPSEMNKSQPRRQKRKSTPLTNPFDNNNLNTGSANIRQSSEDQEPTEDVTEKETLKKRKASTKGKSLESQKVKFSQSSVRRRRRVEQHLLDTPEADLDTSKMTLKDLIRLAEAKEKIQNKEKLTKNKLQSIEAASNSKENESTKEPKEDQGDMLAPQVKIVNGQIVINEESLVVSHRELNTEDFRTYRRVEESTSKLNYHTYMNRTPAERWSKSDTELFYKAMQQFGTDFAMIKQLFPGRTRRQVKAKFKIEERKNPLQLSDALFHRTQDHSHFEILIDRLKISTAPAENCSSDCKTSPSTILEDIILETSDEAHEERRNTSQNNSALNIPETQEIEQCEIRPVKGSDSTLSNDSFEEISNNDEANESYKHMEDANVVKEASPSKENATNEPFAKPPKSLFSYQVQSTKSKSLFGYQL